MAKRRTFSLTDAEIIALQTLRDKGQPAYLRERAAALLKVHEGMSAHKVARTGLLKKRHPDTVYTWLRRYEAEGIIGLYHKPGRGRKPAFAPKTEEEAEAELLETVGRDPGQLNPHQTRWTLRTLGDTVPWLADTSPPGIHQILSRLGLSYKRERSYIHSPDPDYTAKLARVEQALTCARENPERYVVLYQDEFGFYRQPTIAKDWAETGTKTPLACRSYHGQEACYGIGALNALTSDGGQFLRFTEETIGFAWHSQANLPAVSRRCGVSAGEKLHSCGFACVLQRCLRPL